METQYEKYVRNRSKWAYYRGLISRLLKHYHYLYVNYVARKKGAIIGDYVTMPLSLAKKMNSNCVIGNHVSINTNRIDTRAPLKIGDNVIIGAGTEIITVSHNIDSSEWEPKYYGLAIEQYVWLANNSLVLPSCRIIGEGAVVGAGSVVVRDIEPMTVVSGNPAIELRKRKTVHNNLHVERLLHGDFKIFRDTYRQKQ